MLENSLLQSSLVLESVTYPLCFLNQWRRRPRTWFLSLKVKNMVFSKLWLRFWQFPFSWFTSLILGLQIMWRHFCSMHLYLTKGSWDGIKNLNRSVVRPSSIIVFWIAIQCLFLVQITSVIWFEWVLFSSYYSRLVLILNELRQDNVFSLGRP